MKSLPLAVIGAGLIGQTHIDRALKQPDIDLVGLADPADEGRRVAESANVPWFFDFDRMLDSVRPRGVVIATPNATHARIAVRCLEHGVAVLVEKPIADTLEDAKEICEASAATALPAIVGHQRRHNRITRAREADGRRREAWTTRMRDGDVHVAQARRIFRNHMAAREGRRSHSHQSHP